MALLTVPTPFNIDLEFSLAPFMRRALSWICDLVIIDIYTYGVAYFIYNLNSGGIQLETTLLVFLILLPIMTYHLLFEVFNNGRSIGKMLTGLKVLSLEGASPSLSQYLLRWILLLPNYFLLTFIRWSIWGPAAFLYVAIMMLIFSLPDIICMAVTTKSQRLGDLAAGTVVVDTKYKMDIYETIYMDVNEAAYQPVFPQVLKLSDRDINGIRNLLGNKRTKHTEDFMGRVAARIEQVLDIKMNGEPALFLHTLIKDYNYLTQHGQ